MGYTNIDNNIMNYNISGGAFKLYFLLQSMCYSEKTQCFPSQKYLAERLNKSVRTIQRYLDELIKARLIEKKRRGSISNLYTVALKVISQKANEMVERVKKIKDKNSKQNNSYNCSNNSKGYRSYNSYNKGTSNWNIDSRNYDFQNLEDMLLGYERYDANRLYK
ncbi:helix-turn-helix domain-containing protein [Clostridium amazonitimonense]|uniref:helix-turn-helix domain-containing protein n=1 Tax=Clostridium amazonitimonense TaxID=1499689 RepID=UPI000509DDFC|nr:helix-turn-helix domain-containing protein [Clostridium amazonitimonense]